MALLPRLFGRKDQKSYTLTDHEAFGLFGAIPTASGLHVSAAAALRVPAVACAVSLIADTLGTLPVKLHNRADKTVQGDHPAYWLLHDEANEWQSAGALRTSLTMDALTRDSGGFAVVTRASDGRPLELHRLDPSTVTPQTAPDGAPQYLVQSARGKTIYPHTEILHIAPLAGISPLSQAREAIGLALAFEAHLGDLFRNGGRPSGVITAPKPVTPETAGKIAKSWFTTHSGRNSGNVAFLDNGMAYAPLATTLTDAQFAENRTEQIREIARAFRIPAPMIGELGRATWSNLEQLNRQFLQTTLAPWLRNWEAAYSRVLLTPEERRALRVEFVVDALLETDSASRATAYGQYRSMGVMTANEVRAGLNLPANAEGNSLANPYTSTTDTEAAA